MQLTIQQIKKLPQGETVTGVFAIARFEARSTERAGRFGLLTLTDVTGGITSKIWSLSPAQEAVIKANRYCRISGSTNLYNNEQQLIITEVAAVDKEMLSGVLRQLIPHVEGDLEQLYQDILQAVAAIAQPELRRTVELLITEPHEFSRRFRLHPGALGYHHAAVGGLLKHTHEVLSYALDFCQRDASLDRDMMTALAVLHDIGKVQEIEVDDYGLPTGFSKEGKLLGHICLGLKLVAAAGAEAGLDDDTALVLEHGICSHHGAPEWGSPVLPKTKEAQLIHYLDNISAKSDQFATAARDVESGAFSAYDRGLQREIYKP